MLASLPVFLLGGLAVLVRDDLGFSEVQLGLAASTFFTVAALTAVPAGRVAARTGAWAATVLGAATSALALLAMSAAQSYVVLLLALAVGGVANSLAQIGTNGTLAEVVPKHRQGLAFGVKQAAIPAATFVAGFSLPLVGLTLGWRVSFAASALLAVAYVLLAPRTRRRPPTGGVRRRRRGDVAVLALSVVAAAAALASAAVNGLAAFLVESAVAVGPVGVGRRGAARHRQRARRRRARARRLARRPAGGRPPAHRRRHDGDRRGRHGAVRDRGAGRLSTPGPRSSSPSAGAGRGCSPSPSSGSTPARRHAPRATPRPACSPAGRPGRWCSGCSCTAGSYRLAWSVAAVAMLLASAAMLAGRRMLLAARAR